MTNDELERIMNFIIERQERITEQQELTQTILIQLARRDEQLARRDEELARRDEQLARHDDDKEQRIARFERSYTAISDLLVNHDDQLIAVTDNVNKLTDVVAALSATVDRYISARGNDGTNGGQP